MPDTPDALTPAQIDTFVTDGFVKIENAFSADLAAQGRAILWRDTGCDPDDPSSWTMPVVRLGGYYDPPFREAANTPRLHAAYDQLVGQGRWIAPQGLGTFPVRFPSSETPGDDGWHVDVSFGLPEDDPNDFLSWRPGALDAVPVFRRRTARRPNPHPQGLARCDRPTTAPLW